MSLSPKNVNVLLLTFAKVFSSQAVVVVIFNFLRHPSENAVQLWSTRICTDHLYDDDDDDVAAIVPHCSASAGLSHSVFPSIMHKTIIFAHTAINPQIAIANSRCNQYSAQSVISLSLPHFIPSCRLRKSASSRPLIDDYDDESEDSEDDKASSRFDGSPMDGDL